MTPKERAAMQQALEALEEAYENGFLTGIAGFKTIDTLTTLREALAEQAEQEPVAWVDLEQWQSGEYDCFTSEKVADYMTPLYAAIVRTKDLTDDEIKKLQHEIDWTAEWSYVNFARAVIAADREKNK